MKCVTYVVGSHAVHAWWLRHGQGTLEEIRFQTKKASSDIVQQGSLWTSSIPWIDNKILPADFCTQCFISLRDSPNLLCCLQFSGGVNTPATFHRVASKFRKQGHYTYTTEIRSTPPISILPEQ